jgi:hypothetical protein
VKTEWLRLDSLPLKTSIITQKKYKPYRQDMDLTDILDTVFKPEFDIVKF